MSPFDLVALPTIVPPRAPVPLSALQLELFLLSLFSLFFNNQSHTSLHLNR